MNTNFTNSLVFKDQWWEYALFYCDDVVWLIIIILITFIFYFIIKNIMHVAVYNECHGCQEWRSL